MRHRNFQFSLAIAFCLGIAGCKTGEAPTKAAKPTRTRASSTRATPSRSTNARDSNDGNLLLGNPTNAAKTPIIICSRALNTR